MSHSLFRSFLSVLLFSVPTLAFAVGLGELRGQPVLGERLRLEIDILGAERGKALDASCFRLIRPASADDLPWLQQASFSVRSGRVPVLEIRTHAALRDPLLQLGLQLGCGYEISRQYMLLAMPGVATDLPETTAGGPEELVTRSTRRVAQRTPRETLAVAEEPVVRQRSAPPRQPRPRAVVDRLTLSGGGDHGDQPLRMATELGLLRNHESFSEAQREILRLEFRMLMVLSEQATTQLATAEKLRGMEATLGELQERAGEFAARVEREGAPAVSVSTVKSAMPAGESSASAPTLPDVPGSKVGMAGMSEWSLYGLLIGALSGLAVWFGWRRYRQQRSEAEAFPILSAEHAPEEMPATQGKAHAVTEVDIGVEPAHGGQATSVDFELDGGDAFSAGSAPAAAVEREKKRDSAMSIVDATVGEHFEANPVMELADIMLSFGRVKGAAQALREYIDSNPQEALQPWIRLMDVYRMAGMREEFLEVARNLNQHFNVEVQSWGDAPTNEQAAAQPRVDSLEELPRIMSMIEELWPAGDVVGYLYQLLRDNRGGKRAGFALPLVEEILFLIELKETSNRIEKKEESHE
ncbi:MAG: hypothetical protein F9K30_06275 [Dechloromonas sp.]|nr:MAG: hypothetical protein F9K30_06275 [Dechloromonas sp.]